MKNCIGNAYANAYLYSQESCICEILYMESSPLRTGWPNHSEHDSWHLLYYPWLSCTEMLSLIILCRRECQGTSALSLFSQSRWCFFLYFLHTMEFVIHVGIGKHAYKQFGCMIIKSMSTFFKSFEF